VQQNQLGTIVWELAFWLIECWDLEFVNYGTFDCKTTHMYGGVIDNRGQLNAGKLENMGWGARQPSHRHNHYMYMYWPKRRNHEMTSNWSTTAFNY